MGQLSLADDEAVRIPSSSSKRRTPAMGWPAGLPRRLTSPYGERRGLGLLRVYVLWEQAVVDGAHDRPLGLSARALALVGCLVLHAGLPQSRQHLAGLLWPDSSGAQALTNLRRELHHLRRTLQDRQVLEVTATHLCWPADSEARVDLLAFREERRQMLATVTEPRTSLGHARSALAAYTGDFLPGVDEPWAATARDQLRQECVDVCEAGVAAARLVGEPRTGLELAKRLVGLRPLDEQAHRTVMGLQAELGDRAEAINTYHGLAAMLADELGVDPDPRTTEMLEQLLGRQPATQATPRPRLRSTRPGLVARESELARLRSCWQEARVGRPQVVLVCGMPGVGKTRLVGELMDTASRDGAVVASTVCYDTSGHLSLGPVADWLREPSFRAVAARLPLAWQAEVARLVPQEDGRPDPGRPDAWQRPRFFEGLARCLTGGERPVLFVLDNAQWVDEDTLGFLHYLLGGMSTAPVLLAMTLRTGEHDPDDVPRRWVARLRPSAPVTEVDLAPLDQHATADLVGLLNGERPEGERLDRWHAATGGFPLYIVEAARTANGASNAPTAILRRRFEQAGTEARELAALAAAWGRNFSLPLMCQASDLDDARVVVAVDELWRLGMVRAQRDGQYDFSHDLLREVALEQVSPPRRWLLHRRLAAALEQLNSHRLDDIAAPLAEQYRKAGDRDRALTFSRRAAETAAGLFAHAEAIRLARTSLDLVSELPPGPDRDRQELACLEILAAPLNATRGYAHAEVRQTMERTVELGRRLHDDESVVTGLMGLWASRFVRGRNQEAHAIAGQLRELTGPDDPRLPRAQLCFAGSELHIGRSEAALVAFDDACTGFGDETMPYGALGWVHARAWSAHAAWRDGASTDAATRAQEAIDRAREGQHPYSLAVALAYGCLTRQLVGDHERLEELVAELRVLCRRHEFAYYGDWAEVLGGWVLGGPAGLRRAQRGCDHLRRSGSLARAAYWLTLLAELQPDSRSA
ncbi:MAG: AAA family ATPase, partial [Pedococcus sp.]